MPNIGAAIGGTATDGGPHSGGPHFGHRGRKPGFAGDLLGNARQAGIVGAPLRHKVEGSAHLRVDVHGPATAKMQKMDGMFTKVSVSRGRAMPPAHQDG